MVALVILGLPILSEAKDCSKHPIYCQIVRNSPKINKKYAMRLSNVIYKYTRKYNLDKTIFTAILAQESMYRLDAINCHKGIRWDEAFKAKTVGMEVFNKCLDKAEIGTKEFVNCVNDSHEYTKTTVCSDFGIGQIYYKTVEGYGFELDKLMEDLDYSVKAAAQVLHDFKKRYGKRESDYWTRYNASSKEKREIYKHLVVRYF